MALQAEQFIRGQTVSVVMSPPPGAPPAPVVETPAPPPTPEPSGLEPASPDAPSDDEAPDEPGDDTPDQDEGEEGEPVTVAEHQRKRPKRRPDAEARIHELTARMNETQRELAAERRQREALLTQLLRQQQGQQQPTDPTPPPAIAEAAPPNEDDFDTREDYLAARMEWRIEQGIQKGLAAIEAKAAQQQQHQAQRTLEQRLEARFMSGRSLYPDFDTAIHDPGNAYVQDLIPVLHEIVANHEHGHVLMYALATDPAMRENLNDRSPAGAKRYLQQCLTELTQPKPAPAPARTPSAARPAPQPIAPVNGNAAPTRQDWSAIANSQGSLLDYDRARGPYRP